MTIIIALVEIIILIISWVIVTRIRKLERAESIRKLYTRIDL